MFSSSKEPMGMTKQSTPFGQPLSAESRKLVNEVKLNITQPIHPTFDTDFNIYRFILNSERVHKKREEVVETASKALNNHLRMRKALQLDTKPTLSFDENPIFEKRLMPRGDIQPHTDIHNRLLWYIDYASITVESIAHGCPSSEACLYQFWQFERMLREVMAQEEKTGKLSSLRHVVDMSGYEINPFTMLFVSSGTLAYYSQLFHFENYPELVSPAEMVNIARWIHVPYRLAKGMMPAGFGERFRLYDSNFLQILEAEVSLDHIPTTMGGKNESIKCIPAVKLPESSYWQPPTCGILDHLETVHVPARKHKHWHVDVTEKKQLRWYFRTDGDVFFGVFFEPLEQEDGNSNMASAHKKGDKKEEFDHDKLEMVYPWLKLTAKLVHERTGMEAERPGRYHIVFCNKHSWLSKRTVDIIVHINDPDGSDSRRLHSDGTLSVSTLNV